MRKFFLLLTGLAFLVAAGLGALVWSGLHDDSGRADFALVLGNTVNPDGSPSPRLKARLDKAVEFYRAGYFPKIIVSGGTGKEGVPEGTAMKRYLMAEGVPEAAIVVDDAGVDTYASARNTAEILRREHGRSVFVITQYFHVPRSCLALVKLGVSPVYHAHADYFEGRDIYSTLREGPAYLKYFLGLPTKQS